MKMLRIVAAGALSYLAYRAWSRNREDADEAVAVALPDPGTRTAPHGDALTDGERADAASTDAPARPNGG